MLAEDEIWRMVDLEGLKNLHLTGQKNYVAF